MENKVKILPVSKLFPNFNMESYQKSIFSEPFTKQEEKSDDFQKLLDDEMAKLEK